MKLLLDTCAISEWGKPNGDPDLKKLIDMADDNDLFMSAVSLTELFKSAFLLDEGKRKREILLWISTLEKTFGNRILAFNQETSPIWGEITAKTQKTGRVISVYDGLIAATALQHGLHLVTRNSADFGPCGVLIINPWVKK